jgi:hypothetical protein
VPLKGFSSQATHLFARGFQLAGKENEKKEARKETMSGDMGKKDKGVQKRGG